ncbi:hypothetical protein BEWA_049500 [Theileria equi strain WA]|uniref:Uncharacterized protein n=1 Tax=Theileria equi strain WA TaxID=1537102 RepID=L1LBD9_THEEQ|nr:hypothetical protein BEWA_049500 [Theileria equi strain WA]EKX72483.1 hypothetical protein BEWA_049500 [Theileria equi strain WA]|eukprot:XP_004831935.1 hypothetical protein BEWA_049500 [Theileria equi strain WA]
MGQKYSVVVDISQNKKLGNDTDCYNDGSGNLVGLFRRDHYTLGGEKFHGFKFYKHILPDQTFNSYYFTEIRYAWTPQDEFPGLDKYSSVSVYYWEADYDNLCPLFLELGDIDQHPKTLYKASGIRSNDWTKLEQQSHDTIRRVFKNTVVINLQKSDGKNYTPYPSKDGFKDGNEISETKFPRMTVKEEKDKPCQGYVTITQQLEGIQHMNILSTWNTHKNNHIRFKESIVQNKYKSARIYYSACNTAYGGGESTGDPNLNNPLILELVKDGEGVSEFYTIKNQRWEKDPNINTNNLIEKLDEQNCKFNNIFAVDISKTTESYSCKPDCEKHEITVSEYPTGNIPGYGNIQHVPKQGYGDILGRIKKGKSSLTLEGQDFPIPRVSQVLLYYPKCNPKEPILLRIYHGNGGNEWFKRASISGNKWIRATEEEVNKISTVGRAGTRVIRKVLDDLNCYLNQAVTVDITQSNSTNKVNGQYCCNNHYHRGAEKVSVTARKVANTIEYYKHDVNTSDGSTVVAIKYYENSDTNTPSKRIKLGGLILPTKESVKVYTFYSNKKNPVLIYLDYDGLNKDNIRGWYEPNHSGGDQWTRFSSVLPEDGPDNIKASTSNLYQVIKELKCRISGPGGICDTNSRVRIIFEPTSSSSPESAACGQGDGYGNGQEKSASGCAKVPPVLNLGPVQTQETDKSTEERKQGDDQDEDVEKHLDDPQKQTPDSGLSEEVKKGLEIGGYTLGSIATVGTVAGLGKAFWGTIAAIFTVAL